MRESLNNPGQILRLHSNDCQVWYEQGEILANLGYHRAALDCFQRVVEAYPLHVEAWIFCGVELIHVGDYRAALDACDRAIQLSPHNSEAWTFRGVALQRMHRYKEAYASYEQALGTQPQTVWSSLNKRVLLPLKKILRGD